jgi:Protein of unknown function (DUF2934)
MATESPATPVELESETADRRASRRKATESDQEPTPSEIAAEAAAIYPDTFDTPPSPEEIAEEAYHIYVARGAESGHDLDDWLEAERRVTARRAART